MLNPTIAIACAPPAIAFWMNGVASAVPIGTIVVDVTVTPNLFALSRNMPASSMLAADSPKTTATLVFLVFFSWFRTTSALDSAGWSVRNTFG